MTEDALREYLIGVEEDFDIVESLVRDAGGEVLEQIGRTTLKVGLPPSKPADIAEHPEVIMVEPNRDDVRLIVDTDSEPNYQKTSSMEAFQGYAEILNRIDALKAQLLREIAGDVPQSVFSPGFDKMDMGTTRLRSDLEDRMAKEHPDDWTTEVFYGNNDGTEEGSDGGTSDEGLDS